MHVDSKDMLSITMMAFAVALIVGVGMAVFFSQRKARMCALVLGVFGFAGFGTAAFINNASASVPHNFDLAVQKTWIEQPASGLLSPEPAKHFVAGLNTEDNSYVALDVPAAQWAEMHAGDRAHVTYLAGYPNLVHAPH